MDKFRSFFGQILVKFRSTLGIFFRYFLYQFLVSFQSVREKKECWLLFYFSSEINCLFICLVSVCLDRRKLNRFLASRIPAVLPSMFEMFQHGFPLFFSFLSGLIFFFVLLLLLVVGVVVVLFVLAVGHFSISSLG